MTTENNTGGEITHRFIETNGIRMHIAEQGTGPLVLLCHGFPELWYSWRYQIPALAVAGYHVVAPDQRGYGQTDAPDAIEAYTMLHLVGDMVGLLDVLGEEQAVIVGHDWGANVAWNAALLRPDRFRAVIAMSVPYVPRGPAHGSRSTVRPTAAMKQAVGDKFFYQLYFQQPGLAEAELERDVRATMTQILYGLSGDVPAETRWSPFSDAPDASMLTSAAQPASLPDWLTESDIDYYTSEYQRTGFRGGLNWYRNLDRTWELMAAYSRAKVMQPALFLWGDRDPSLDIPGVSERIERMHEYVPLVHRELFAGCGHWLQQERAAATNEAIIAFLRGL
jgi:pimeloyl-ACP methyl ester carboxylesterase